jgi:hypothetical protein
MTRTTNARLAGFPYLFYIALAIPAMVLFDKATSAEGTAAKLARIAEHPPRVRWPSSWAACPWRHSFQ